jgi:hypothetical protein
MAVSKSKLQLKNKKVFAFPHRHFLLTHIPYFFNCFRSAFVMPCVPRTFSIRSYLTHSKLTSQLVPVTVLARADFFLGESEERAPALFFVRALYGRAGPPDPPFTPSVRARGRSTTSVRSSLRLLRACLISTVIFPGKVRAARSCAERQNTNAYCLARQESSVH